MHCLASKSSFACRWKVNTAYLRMDKKLPPSWRRSESFVTYEPRFWQIRTDINLADYHWSNLSLFNRYSDGETTSPILNADVTPDGDGDTTGDTCRPTRQRPHASNSDQINLLCHLTTAEKKDDVSKLWDSWMNETKWMNYKTFSADFTL